MKGNTQLPQLPVFVVFEEGKDVDTGEGDGVGVVVGMRRRNAVYLTSHLIIR